jgi:hypothetical protein
MGTHRNRWGYRGATTSGTSSFGGGCGYLQNLNNRGASIKQKIITAFEPMYLAILNNNMVGFDNTTERDMLDHLFLSYGSITSVDLEHNLENMRKAWGPQKPV